MARDTVSTIIERVNRQLAATVRMEINVLGASLNATETTVTFTHPIPNSLRSGAVLSLNGELMRVITADELAQEAVVLRGWQDSTAAAHTAGTEVHINPRFTRFDILDALIEEIDTWAPDLFDVQYVEAATTEETNAVELAAAYAGALGVTTVRRNWTDDAESLVWPTISYTLQRGSTSVWSAASESGLIVRLTNNGVGRARTGSLLIGVAMPYDPSDITEATVLSTDKNITSSLLELIELGIKYRLLQDDEIGRSQRGAQDEPRRAEEVPPNTALTIGQVMQQRYERRRNAEVIRFRTLHPMEAW